MDHTAHIAKFTGVGTVVEHANHGEQHTGDQAMSDELHRRTGHAGNAERGNAKQHKSHM